MKRLFAVLTLAAMLVPAQALADERSAAINAFTAEQAIDCITTLAVLHGGGYERDPLAAPFTHSALTEIGAAAAVNIFARRLPLRILHTMVYVYPVVLFGNIHALGSGGPSPGIVPPAFSAGAPVRHPH